MYINAIFKMCTYHMEIKPIIIISYSLALFLKFKIPISFMTAYITTITARKYILKNEPTSLHKGTN